MIEIIKSSLRAQQRAARDARMTVQQWRDAIVDRQVMMDRWTNRCYDCRKLHHPYMVSDVLWSFHGVGDAELCLPCLERRAHRRVAIEDVKLCGVTLRHPRLRRLIVAELCRWPSEGRKIVDEVRQRVEGRRRSKKLLKAAR